MDETFVCFRVVELPGFPGVEIARLRRQRIVILEQEASNSLIDFDLPARLILHGSGPIVDAPARAERAAEKALERDVGGREPLLVW